MQFMKEKLMIIIWILFQFSIYPSLKVLKELIVQFSIHQIHGKINNNSTKLYIKLQKCSIKTSRNIKILHPIQLKLEPLNYD